MARRWRPLTAGEIAMASLLFRDAIDTTRVRVFSRRYLPYLQPQNCAMTPNGSMYFHHSCFLDDYAQANLTGRHWFMHEMVLLWQFAHRSHYVAGLLLTLAASAPWPPHQCCDDHRANERNDNDVKRLLNIHSRIKEEY